MNEFFTDIWQVITHLSLREWLVIIVLLGFAVNGFRRGAALVAIRLVWILLGWVVATIYYANLEAILYLDWLGQYASLGSFLLILLLFFAVKMLLYNVFEKIANLHGPCSPKPFIVLVATVVIGLGLSSLMAYMLYDMPLLAPLSDYDSRRFFGVFIVFSALIAGVAGLLMRASNMRISLDDFCPLFVVMQPLDDWLNARRIQGKTNSIMGLFIGILQGLIVLILAVVITNYHPESPLEGSVLLPTLQTLTIEVRSFLSDYLGFIY